MFCTGTFLKTEDLEEVMCHMQLRLKLGKYSNLVLIKIAFKTLKIEVDEHNTTVIQ
jgi:hypothetical protein